MRGLLLITALLLGSCVDTAPGEISDADAAACEARGGFVGVAGFSGEEFCAEPTPDAGQMCSRASDCESYCVAETRTCNTHFSPFGCYSYLDEEGQVVSICVD